MSSNPIVSSNPWGDVPTWITAGATLGLFIGAIFTAVYAKRTYSRDKSQFQLQQAKPILLEIIVLMHRLRSYAKRLLDQNFGQWDETTLLTEDDALLKGAELLAAGYPQFQEKLVILAGVVDQFNRLLPDRNRFLLENPVAGGENGIELFSEEGKKDPDGFRYSNNEAKGLLENIEGRCKALEQAVQKAFDDLRE